jgi:hypothetical protein
MRKVCTLWYHHISVSESLRLGMKVMPLAVAPSVRAFQFPAVVIKANGLRAA